MRNLACFLLLCCGSAATLAAETWRWVDASGVTHYSDRPVPGAERMDLKTPVRPATTAAPASSGPVTAAPPAAPLFEPYTRCVVSQPANDQVFVNVRTVMVSIEVEPSLQGDHRVQVVLNGSAVPDWPALAMGHVLTGLYRGSYTLNARVVDAQARTLCSGPVINFHVRLPSVNSPARQRAGGN